MGEGYTNHAVGHVPGALGSLPAHPPTLPHMELGLGALTPLGTTLPQAQEGWPGDSLVTLGTRTRSDGLWTRRAALNSLLPPKGTSAWAAG